MEWSTASLLHYRLLSVVFGKKMAAVPGASLSQTGWQGSGHHLLYNISECCDTQLLYQRPCVLPLTTTASMQDISMGHIYLSVRCGLCYLQLIFGHHRQEAMVNMQFVFFTVGSSGYKLNWLQESLMSFWCCCYKLKYFFYILKYFCIENNFYFILFSLFVSVSSIALAHASFGVPAQKCENACPKWIE